MNDLIEYENLKKANQPFEKEFEMAFKKFLESGWYILGKEVSSFENEFAEYLKAPYCVGVASGLDALILSLEALDLPAGSEVLVPSNTYIATIMAILKAGHKPILVEPDIETYNIDPKKLSKALTKNTKAMMIVHLYGKPCAMDQITDFCKEHQLHLIEDCAQSHGASFNGKMTGTFGSFGAFSFYPTKNLGALGDAGAVTTNSLQMAEKIQKLRNYGSKIRYQNELIGTNSRLDELQAAFLRIKLKALDRLNFHKKSLADVYYEQLKGIVICPAKVAKTEDVYHIFNIRLEKRDALKAFLMENGIKTDVHYPTPPEQQPAYKEFLKGSYPISEEIHKTTLSLPISSFHTKEDVIRVSSKIREFIEGNK